MYTSTDPRSTLAAQSHDDLSRLNIAVPESFDFSRGTPTSVSPVGTKNWTVRGQNFVLQLSTPVPGDSLGASNLATEQVLILAAVNSSVSIKRGQRTVDITGPAMVVIPHGHTEITAVGAGNIVRLVEASETEWADRAQNAVSYDLPHPRVRMLERWPEPAPGPDVRVYRFQDVPDKPGRFGRIYRTRSFMVNFLNPQEGPRDPSSLSPHHHDDFEQCSLALSGEFVHHIRTPWISDKCMWRDDEHIAVSSPSAVIIPPPTVHTSEAVGTGTNWLVDIFSPPRADFSAQDGWVLNAEEYPTP